MMVSKIKKKLERELKLFSIKYTNFEKIPPILVYQSGKVGSSTVVDSLKAINLDNPIYHVHYLAPDSLVNQTIGKPRFSKALRSKIDSYENTKKINWQIISLTRDPIAITISSLFQKIGISKENLFLTETGEINTSLIFQKLDADLNNFNNSKFCTWFDRELKTVFNVDIFNYHFNRNLGYTIVKKNNIDVLCFSY